MATVLERFYSHVQYGDNGCWWWTGALRKGYGTFKIGSRTDGTRKDVYAHRYVWASIAGQIADNLQIDHLCRNTKCVNPMHMEVVTPQVNTLRGEGPTARQAAQTHCKEGHEFTPENTYLYKNMRICRVCQRRRVKEHRIAKKGGVVQSDTEQ